MQTAAGIFINHLLAGAACRFSADISPCIMKGLNMLLHPWFIILLLLFIGHQTAQKIFGFNHTWIDSYLDSLLLMPILLHLLLWERRYLFGRGPDYKLSRQYIIIILILVSVLSEYAFPLWNKAFTADRWDLLCYFTGSLFFYSCQSAEKSALQETTVQNF